MAYTSCYASCVVEAQDLTPVCLTDCISFPIDVGSSQGRLFGLLLHFDLAKLLCVFKLLQKLLDLLAVIVVFLPLLWHVV